MIFMTLGTTFMRFDRLVEALDRLVEEGYIKEEVFAQIGVSKYVPRNMKYKRMLDKVEFDDYFNKASIIIGHAGMGTINMAMNSDKAILVVPRRKEFHEHVNNHQVWTAEKFHELGHIIYCDNLEDSSFFIKKIEEAKMFKGKKREDMAGELAKDIWEYIQGLMGDIQ